MLPYLRNLTSTKGPPTCNHRHVEQIQPHREYSAGPLQCQLPAQPCSWRPRGHRRWGGSGRVTMTSRTSDSLQHLLCSWEEPGQTRGSGYLFPRVFMEKKNSTAGSFVPAQEAGPPK